MITHEQAHLYHNLMFLADTEESFFFAEQTLAGNIYRIFLYRLASYSQWLLPSAREARGITFEVEESGEPIALVSRPLHKFFNLYENPFTMEVDMTNAYAIYDKLDGSLITTMNVNDSVWLKSKGSLFSDQAQAANRLLATPEYESLREFFDLMLLNDITVCMEYMAPDNRIVIGYTEPRLGVFALRDNKTGTYIPLEVWEHEACEAVDFFSENLIEHIEGQWESVQAFVDDIPDMEKMEGFVIWTAGETVKIKTEWYMVLHHLKDSINSQRRLYEAVVYETIDDVRAQFHDDPVALQIIEDMEEKVRPIYNNMVTLVEGFYEANKHLDRKEYAIKGQAECGKLYFGLAMSLYLGREVNYREHMIKYRKDYGIKDDPVATPVEMPE